jgi:hypothetical protein
MSTGTFAAFSKFPLNTSNSPNTKVVHFVEGHNFHVEWHCWFELQIGENCKSTLLVTIHRRPENSRFGIQFMLKWLRKRPYAFYESCRAMQDLQLWYSKVCLLQFKNFEKNPPEQGYPELFGAGTRGSVGTHDVALGPVGFTAVRRRTRTPR